MGILAKKYGDQAGSDTRMSRQEILFFDKAKRRILVVSIRRFAAAKETSFLYVCIIPVQRRQGTWQCQYFLMSYQTLMDARIE